MSHIIGNKIDIKKISSYLDLLRNNSSSKDSVIEILNGILPISDKLSINIDVSDNSGAAYFDSEDKLIHINIGELNEYVKNYSLDMINMNHNLCDCSKDLYVYNMMFALVHEIEHVYQYMFGLGYLDAPYDIVGNLYGKLFKYHLDDDMNGLIKRILLYKKINYSSKVDFVLERNANIETCDLLRRVCEYENNMEILGSINYEYLTYMKLGYLRKKYNGAFDESFSKIWRKDLFDREILEDISVEDRIRYGLPIDDESRRLLLRLE